MYYLIKIIYSTKMQRDDWCAVIGCILLFLLIGIAGMVAK